MKVIGWFHFGNMRHKSVRRSMQLMAREVIQASSAAERGGAGQARRAG